MTDVSSLSHEDQISLWTGRIVRLEASIESMLRAIYYRLCGGGLSFVIVPSSFAAQIQGIRGMLNASLIEDPTYVDECLAVLNRLGLAHKLRNKVVHDQWVQMDDPAKFRSATKGISRGDKPEAVWDVEEFEKCYHALRDCYVPVNGIYWTIDVFLGESDFFASHVPMNREAIAGRVKVTSPVGSANLTWEYTDPEFAEALRVALLADAADFRAQMEGLN